MSCIGPVQPDDFELLAYADNTASADLEEHLSACLFCQARTEELQQQERYLKALLYRAGCPRPSELSEHRLGLLAMERVTEVSAHLEYCPACRAELAVLDEFMTRVALRGDDPAARAIGALRTVLARLSNLTGGAAGSLAPALRGSNDESGSSPVVYDADNILITLETLPERTGRATRQVIGLVAGPTDFTSAEAEMVTEGAYQSVAPIDNLGNFALRDVPIGRYRLLIRLPLDGVEILIDDVTVH